MILFEVEAEALPLNVIILALIKSDNMRTLNGGFINSINFGLTLLTKTKVSSS